MTRVPPPDAVAAGSATPTATVLARGVPIIQHATRGSILAAQAVAERLRTGIFFEFAAHLGEQLRREVRTGTVRSHVVDGRNAFTFDAHANRLVEFFRRTLDRRARRPLPALVAVGGRRRRRDTKLQGTPTVAAG